MTRDEIERTVRKIIVEDLDIVGHPLSLDTSLAKELGADSLDMAEITMEIEDEFYIDLPGDIDENATTVGGLIDLAEKAIRAKKGVEDAPQVSEDAARRGEPQGGGHQV